MKLLLIILLNFVIVVVAIFGMAYLNVFYLKWPDPIPSLFGGVYGLLHICALMIILERRGKI